MVTSIFVPALHFADGYAATVTGAKVVSVPGAGLLRVRNAPGAKTVSARLSPQT